MNKNVLSFEDRGFWLKSAESEKPKEFDWKEGVREVNEFVTSNTDIRSEQKEKDGVPAEMMTLMSSIFIMVSTVKHMGEKIVELEKALADAKA